MTPYLTTTMASGMEELNVCLADVASSCEHRYGRLFAPLEDKPGTDWFLTITSNAKAGTGDFRRTLWLFVVDMVEQDKFHPSRYLEIRDLLVKHD